MQMDGWADYLHTSLNGEHVLFPALRLNSFGAFISAAALSASICLAERCVFCAHSHSSNSEKNMNFDTQLPDLCSYAALDPLPSRPPVAHAQCALADRHLLPSDALTTVRLSPAYLTLFLSPSFHRLYMLLSMTFHVW